jgi:hypothetical protein
MTTICEFAREFKKNGGENFKVQSIAKEWHVSCEVGVWTLQTVHTDLEIACDKLLNLLIGRADKDEVAI